ncbi:MAG: DEAD/DEAH box helicase, partial [Pseudomonadota bacterium]
MFDFEMLGLAPSLNAALERSGLGQPTPIQNQAIPLAMEGHDILGLAQTGTGKTLAFGLPLINHLLKQGGRPAPKTAKSLILAPTRELVNQIADSLRALTEKTHLRVTTVVGGQSIGRQINQLSRGTDILVATPGRLIDLMDRRAVDLGSVRHLVLDEADQMLDLGFIHALRRIAPELGTPRQTMLFSATMPKQMEELSRAYLDNPRKVQVSPPGKAADKIRQSVHFMNKPAKPERLREILSRDMDALTLVFSRTKHGAEKLMKGLVADGFNAASIHGNKSQGQRDRAIKAFRDGDVKVLVATDVAARGIDIPGVAYVI